jgi:hypothetical protein
MDFSPSAAQAAMAMVGSACAWSTRPQGFSAGDGVADHEGAVAVFEADQFVETERGETVALDRGEVAAEPIRAIDRPAGFLERRGAGVVPNTGRRRAPGASIAAHRSFLRGC